MIIDHFIRLLINNFPYHLTQSQEKLLKNLAEFCTNPNHNDIFLIQGYAGTGKTTVVNALVKTFKEIGGKFVLLAPTGRAAKVLFNYCNTPAYTIHKKIYRQKSSNDGFGTFIIDKNLHTNTYFIIDEGSMISNQKISLNVFGTGRLLDDIIEYVFTGKNNKLIIIGDDAQLPPVGTDLSPALDKKVLDEYLLNVKSDKLTDITRQNIDSDILFNANKLRKQITENSIQLPNFRISEKNDCSKITGEELIECINTEYDKNSIGEVVIINRSNKRANKYNQGIRNGILFREEELVVGDLLMVVKNNYYWMKETEEMDFIANGDIIEILKINKYYEIYGYRFVDVVVKFVDYNIELYTKIFLDILTIDYPSLPSEKNKELFYKIYEDYIDEKPKKKGFDKVKNNPFFNALQVKFAYAITCHKAQGGQWKTVFIDQGFIDDGMINKDYLRWLYTAITRATEKVYLINFPDKYFL